MPTTTTIAKLNRILDGLMGVKLGLEFNSIDNLSIDAWDFVDLQMLSERSEKNPAYIEDNLGSAFGFPVYLETQLAGLAVVRGWDGARPRQLILLSELITAILERRSNGEDKRDHLKLIEERMIVNEEKPANVIALRNRPRQNKEEVVPTELAPPLELSPLTALPILILTKPGFPLHKAAVEIHELSNRWAMINLKDLTPDTLDTEEGLKQLGGVTLFIESLESLSTEQQIKLAEYLAGHPAPEMPQVIAGMTTTDAFGEDDQAPKVLSILLDQFTHSKLDWADRKPEELTKNFIVACLEVLTEQTRENLTHGEFYLPFNVHQLDPDSPTWH